MSFRALMPTAAVALVVLFAAGCGYPDPATTGGPVATVGETTPIPQAGADDFHQGDGKPFVKFPDGLQMLDLKAGTGKTAPAGSTVRVQYTGWLSNGTQFDSSRQAGRTDLCAILVNTQATQGDCTPVIPGWNEGVPGMKVGGKRKIIIPPGLAYGAQGAPPTIPANATLVFTIELTSLVTTATPPPPSPSPS
ncbi:MAG TPA: FKBP-type peptidyl-prolyl cis-trans isomerase [Candidatus Dormibacteraeota bacterium]